MLADSSKLGLRPLHAWARLALPWTLVTDDGADADELQKFRDAEVTVEVAAVFRDPATEETDRAEAG